MKLLNAKVHIALMRNRFKIESFCSINTSYIQFKHCNCCKSYRNNPHTELYIFIYYICISYLSNFRLFAKKHVNISFYSNELFFLLPALVRWTRFGLGIIFISLLSSSVHVTVIIFFFNFTEEELLCEGRIERKKKGCSYS